MISTFWSHNVRTLAQVAGNAVRAGLPHHAAIRALTSTPAKVFGLKDHGTLRTGALANVVVWTADPLELNSHPVHLWIHGRSVPLVTRQTILQEHHLKNSTTPAPLPLPGTTPTPKAGTPSPSSQRYTPGPSIASINQLRSWLQDPKHSCRIVGPHVRIPVAITFDGALRHIKQSTIGNTQRSLPLQLRDTLMGIPLSDKLNQTCTNASDTCAVWLAGCLGAALNVPDSQASPSKSMEFSVFRFEGPVQADDQWVAYSGVLTSAQ